MPDTTTVYTEVGPINIDWSDSFAPVHYYYDTEALALSRLEKESLPDDFDTYTQVARSTCPHDGSVGHWEEPLNVVIKSAVKEAFMLGFDAALAFCAAHEERRDA